MQSGNYWMKLSIIWTIIKSKVCCYQLKPKAEVDKCKPIEGLIILHIVLLNRISCLLFSKYAFKPCQGFWSLSLFNFSSGFLQVFFIQKCAWMADAILFLFVWWFHLVSFAFIMTMVSVSQYDSCCHDSNVVLTESTEFAKVLGQWSMLIAIF